MTTGAAPKSFAEILSASRREAGYPSARDFYRTVGGRPVLGCTYAQYRNVESGRSTPKPAFVRAVLSFLESKPGDARARETVTAYLRAVLKDDDFLALALEALTPPGPSPIPDDAPMRQALRRNEEARQVRLTHEQAEAIEGDERAYWCFKVFSNDDGDWGTLDLGRLLGYDARAVRAALDRLGRAGLVVKTPEGRYRCFAPRKILVYPRREFHVPENLERWRGHLEKGLVRRGKVEMYQCLVLRASAKRLKGYFPYLSHSVVGADLYATAERGEDTALFVVEGVVRRLFDF